MAEAETAWSLNLYPDAVELQNMEICQIIRVDDYERHENKSL